MQLSRVAELSGVHPDKPGEPNCPLTGRDAKLEAAVPPSQSGILHRVGRPGWGGKASAGPSFPSLKAKMPLLLAASPRWRRAATWHGRR